MRWLRVKKDEDENGMWQCKTWPRTLWNVAMQDLAPYTPYGPVHSGPVHCYMLVEGKKG